MSNIIFATAPSVEESVFSLLAHVVPFDGWALAPAAASPPLAGQPFSLALPLRGGAESAASAWFGRRGAPFSAFERDVLERLLELVQPWLRGAREAPGAQPYAVCVLREGRVVASLVFGAGERVSFGLVPFAYVRTITFGDAVRVLVIERLAGASALVPAARRYGLSPRELDVLRLLLTGSSTGDIAQRLTIGGETVRDHVKNLLRKTGARNRVELVGRALGYDPESSACPSS